MLNSLRSGAPYSDTIELQILKFSLLFSHFLLLSLAENSRRYTDGCDNIGFAAESQGHDGQHNANGNGGNNNNDRIDHIRSVAAHGRRRHLNASWLE